MLVGKWYDTNVTLMLRFFYGRNGLVVRTLLLSAALMWNGVDFEGSIRVLGQFKKNPLWTVTFSILVIKQKIVSFLISIANLGCSNFN